MAWISAVTDRTQADIDNRHNTKAFFDVDTWERIYGNTAWVWLEAEVLLGADITLQSLTAPTMTTIPTAASINALIENINRVVTGAMLPAAIGTTVLKSDWIAGNTRPAPNFEDVNEWEQNLDLLHTHIPHAADYVVSCGVAAAGQPRFYQHRFR